MLQGLERILKNKAFTDCHAINKAREDYQTSSDSVKLFIQENNFKASPEHWEMIKDLYIRYRVFCNEEGSHPVNKQNFIKRLRAFGITIEKRNVGNIAFLSVQSNN